MNDGALRRNPRWWDHQRQPLVALRRCIETVLSDQVAPGRGEPVYDIGCGDRPYEPLVRARGYDYIGCDLDGSPEIHIHPGKPLPVSDGKAAGVVSFQVLEHVWDLDWYLGECHRLLAPDGWLLLSTHGVWPYHPHPADHRRWTRTGLQGELETRGFGISDFRGLLGPLAWTTQIRALGYRYALQAVPGLRVLSPALALGMNIRMSLEEAITPESIRRDNASIYVAFCRRRAAPEPRR